MRTRTPFSLLALGAVLWVAPTADAALPTFKDKTIVVGKSIAGVKLGAGLASGKAAWGKANADCSDPLVCQFRVKGAVSGDKGEGLFSLKGGKISRIQITAPLASGAGHAYKAPFTTPKTSKGIGIGSTEAKLKKAYPKATSPSKGYFVIKSPGRVETSFVVDQSAKRVSSVVVEIIPAGY